MADNDWSLPSKKLVSAFPNLPSSTTRFLPTALGILGFLGFLDATYLTILHYKNAIPPCTLAGGCETVLTSQYSMLFGIPISLIGVVYYITVLALLLVWIQTKRVKWLTLLVVLTGAGLAVAIYLVYLQAFVLHAFCQYCLTSELIDFLLFDCAWWLWRKAE